MESNAEIKPHNGLDVARYSEITGNKRISQRDGCGSHPADSEPASQPAPRPSRNPTWRARVVRGRVLGEGKGGRATAGSRWRS